MENNFSNHTEPRRLGYLACPMDGETKLSASYRHVSTKILNEFPVILDKVSVELGRQRHQIGLSMESPVDDPMKTIESFNRQFGLE